ncbi:hypothetical protein NPIL_302051 [Nephila pilipes]|uniref:Uncharacterized protein n=1 Tax=Nephila pilipes TaxID=299642 RepID=A0A8X6Q5Y3_NEPPI|nr:hypothetical protein NPIL_302051 [Nephila pilipes]
MVRVTGTSTLKLDISPGWDQKVERDLGHRLTLWAESSRSAVLDSYRLLMIGGVASIESTGSTRTGTPFLWADFGWFPGFWLLLTAGQQGNFGMWETEKFMLALEMRFH